MNTPIYTKTTTPKSLGTLVTFVLLSALHGKMYGMGARPYNDDDEYDFIAHFEKREGIWRPFNTMVVRADGSLKIKTFPGDILDQIRGAWNRQALLRDKLTARIAIAYSRDAKKSGGRGTSGFVDALEDVLGHDYHSDPADVFFVKEATKLAKEKNYSTDLLDYGLEE